MEAILTFVDGTVIEAVENGNCFIVPAEPEFPEDLSEVTVEDDSGKKTLYNVTVQEAASVDGRYWFILVEESPADKAMRELREDVGDALNSLLEFVLGEEK